MRILSIIPIISFMFFNCVGPEEPLDGLSKNSPVIVNTNDAFTLSLRAENYTTEENYSLTFPDQNPIEFTTVLIVTDFAGRATDTSYFDLFNSSDSLLGTFNLSSNINSTIVDSIQVNEIPNKIFFKADDFSGFIQLVLAIGD